MLDYKGIVCKWLMEEGVLEMHEQISKGIDCTQDSL